MSAPVKLAGFAATLAMLFGGGALAGGAVGPERESKTAQRADAAKIGVAHGAAAAGHGSASGAVHAESTSGGRGSHSSGGAEKAAHPVRGLAVVEMGLRLVVEEAELRRNRREELRFRVVDDRGETVRDFDVEHTKRMHLIVARRDLSGFQHLHPEQVTDGSWSVKLRVNDAGSYRVFADFSNSGEPYTLASDLRVDGAAALKPLPAPAASAVSDGGYDVRLRASRARPGQEANLRFAITRDGQTVHTEPYLGAGGHLVALREGDLAFLHVHPTEHGDGTKTAHDDSVGFAATFPTAGAYRLFLQFKHQGRVQTVAFTQEVD